MRLLTFAPKSFIPLLANDNMGILLRSAINELDWYYYNMSRSGDPTDEQKEQFYLLQLGVARLMKLSLESRPSFDVPVVMFLRSHDMPAPVLEIAAGLGMIEHGRRVAQTVSTGLCRIEQVGERIGIFRRSQIWPDHFR